MTVDMGLAFKIAGGGFGLVFILLALLYIAVCLTKVITEKITKLKK